MLHTRFLALALVPLLSSCGLFVVPADSTPGGAAALSAAKTAAIGIITGVARAPRSLTGRVLPVGGGNVLPVGGGNVISGNTGSVIPVGGGNLQAFSSLGVLPDRSLLLLTEQPLADAEAYLADAAGQPYPSLPSVKTDADGRFTFPDIPAGHTFMVVVAARDQDRAKDVTLQTLVRSSAFGATTEVGLATSLITVAVTEGQASDLGEFNAAAFRTAAQTTAENVSDTDLPDLSSRSAILAKVDQLGKAVASLIPMITAIREDLKEIKASLEELKTRLGEAPVGRAANGFPGSLPPPPPGNPGTGDRPFPPETGCTGWGEHRFTLKGTYTGYPLQIQWINPHQHAMGSGALFSGPGLKAEGRVPEGCPHILELRDSSGKLLARKEAFITPTGAPFEQEISF